MHSAPWSDSISATNAPGAISTFLCFQLPTSSSSVSERKSLSSLFERHGLTRGPRRLAQDLHKIEDRNEVKMNVKQF